MQLVSAIRTKQADDFSHPFYWAPFFLMGNWLQQGMRKLLRARLWQRIEPVEKGGKSRRFLVRLSHADCVSPRLLQISIGAAFSIRPNRARLCPQISRKPPAVIPRLAAADGHARRNKKHSGIGIQLGPIPGFMCGRGVIPKSRDRRPSYSVDNDLPKYCANLTTQSTYQLRRVERKVPYPHVFDHSRVETCHTRLLSRENAGDSNIPAIPEGLGGWLY